MKTAEELTNDMRQFYGTEEFHRFSVLFPKVVLTDGAKYLADNAEAYWLMDMIASHIRALKGDGFGVAKLQVENNKGIFTLDDGNDNIKARQEIPYTDFPMSSIKLYVADNEFAWTILLPSEY
jgi:hypothetical protein